MKYPKYKIGDIVIVKSKKDPQKIVQGKIVMAECNYYESKQDVWFYGIDIPQTVGESEMLYSYEENVGDAKSVFL